MTPRSNISLAVEEPRWRKAGIDLGRVRTAAALAVSRGVRRGPSGELTILLTGDERLRALNARFRGEDKPTNVLAFPAAVNDGGYLGDVAIALGTAKCEATSAGVGLFAHTLHLTVHGVLHLLGYDHVEAHEARTMERLEILILRELGIPSPYPRRARPAVAQAPANQSSLPGRRGLRAGGAE